MFVFSIDGSAYDICDNTSVTNITTLVNSKLHKKHKSLAYHTVHWEVAAHILRIGKIPTEEITYVVRMDVR